MLWPYYMNHLALSWNVPLHRGIVEYFARYFRVVSLDFRGAGLSDRRIAHLSLEMFAEDFASVLRVLNLERVAVVASGWGSRRVDAAALHRRDTRRRARRSPRRASRPPRPVRP